MNERIKQLAKQSNIHFSRVGILDGDPNGSARMVGYSKMEKFAELIVRECAELNKKQYYELLGVIVDTEENDGFDDTCLDTVKRVAEYLGSDALIDHFGEKQ